MPQMAPMYWLILFILFNMILMLFMKMLYFNSNKLPQEKKNKIEKQMLYWKW